MFYCEIIEFFNCYFEGVDSFPSCFCLLPKTKNLFNFFLAPCPQALLINHQWGMGGGEGRLLLLNLHNMPFETLKVENGSNFRFCSNLAWFFIFQKWPLSPMSPISDNTLEYHRLFHHCTWFQLSASQSQNAIYFSIIAMPKKSHFTIFAMQNFVQTTRKHIWIPLILLGSCL